jgi:hypothetical protein
MALERGFSSLGSLSFSESALLRFREAEIRVLSKNILPRERSSSSFPESFLGKGAVSPMLESRGLGIPESVVGQMSGKDRTGEEKTLRVATFAGTNLETTIVAYI